MLAAAAAALGHCVQERIGGAWGLAGPSRGLYEVLITQEVEASLREIGEELQAVRMDLRSAEAADRIALHVGRIVRRVIASHNEKTRLTHSLLLAQQLLALAMVPRERTWPAVVVSGGWRVG